MRSLLLLAAFACGSPLLATPVNPIAFRDAFDRAKKDAEVVADTRVVTVVCTESAGGAVTLQIALQILAVEKGPVKRNDIVVVSRQVTLPVRTVPGNYAFMAALRQFPFTPGVKGSVALRYDAERRSYIPIAGWVAEPNGTEIPTEVGKAISAKE